MNTFSDLQHKMLSWVMTNRFLKGASIVRICLGIIIVYIYMQHYAQRYYLWGPQGVIPYHEYYGSPSVTFFSLYHYSESVLYFDFIFHIGIIISILFTIGWGGRWINILNFIFVWSLLDRNFIILDGGDNILRIVLFYLIFAHLTAYYSVDAAKRQKQVQQPGHDSKNIKQGNVHTIATSHEVGPFSSYSVILHNVAVIACIVQLCLLYFISGMYQVAGERWHSGTAIYYIFQVQQYTIPWVTENIMRSDYLLVISAYMSILIKIAFPFLLFNKITKYIGVTAITLFHIGIGIGMGLITFSLIMISLELLVFTDHEYQRIGQFKDKMIHNLKTKVLRLGDSLGQKPFLRAQALHVYYDGWCPLCIETVKKLKRWDMLHLVQFVSIRDESIIRNHNIDLKKAEMRMISKTANNPYYYEGIESFIQLSIRIIPLLPLFPLLWISNKVGIGQRVYDFIAEKRNIIPVNQCQHSEQCEVLRKEVKEVR